MGIAAKAPRGGLLEDLAGRSRPLVLRQGEIERFEDAHRGIYDVFDAHYAKGVDLPRIRAREVRDLVALGLVGGGMLDRDADALVSGLPVSENLALRTIALGLIGVAFAPDWVDADDDQGEGQDEKKNEIRAGGGTSGA